jgi:hypothetical protein
MLDQTPSFASVAREIGKPRLQLALEELADDVRRQISLAGFVPLRSDVRKDVKQLRTDAERLDKTLTRLSKERPLDLPFPRDLDLPHARQSIRSLVEWCDKSLSVIPAKGGAPKQPGRTTCAIIVIEAWTYAKGKAPRANNQTVHEICDEYWRACGNASLGEPRNWRRSMDDALRHGRSRRHYQDQIQRHTTGP